MENPVSTSQPAANSMTFVEQIADSVTFEWLLDKHAFALTITNGTRETTDAWFNRVRDVALGWPNDQLVLGLYHYDFDLLSMSPYARSRADALRNLRPEL